MTSTIEPALAVVMTSGDYVGVIFAYVEALDRCTGHGDGTIEVDLSLRAWTRTYWCAAN